MKHTVMVILVLFAMPAFSTTINVPLDQPNIQAGIDAASDDDTVLVAPDIYTGDGNRDIVMNGKRVALVAADGPLTTIIDCEGSDGDFHRGFRLDGGEGPFSVIDGFTITNGFAHGLGGALYCNNTGPTIKNCIFDSNQSDGGGGALASIQASANIENCLFLNNEAADAGGACWLRVANPIFFNCTFYGNGADDSAATILSSASDPVFYNTLITDSRLSGDAIFQTDPYNHRSLFSCSNIWGNPGGDWLMTYPTQLGVNGNISEDPLYCAEVPTVFPDDLYINSQSPCAPENHECGELVGMYGVGCGPTAVDDEPAGQLPLDYSLAQNYPNPFNPATRIDFDLPRGSNVKLRIFNILGQQVATLVDEYRSAGPHVEFWDGSEAVSGVYLYRLEAGERSFTRKMLLLK